MDGTVLQDRVDWEANVRTAKSFEYNVVVQGLRYDDKNVWKPNLLVRVKDKFADIKSRLLISAVTYTKNDTEGTTTKLKLVHPKSYTLFIKKEKSKTDQVGPNYLDEYSDKQIKEREKNEQDDDTT